MGKAIEDLIDEKDSELYHVKFSEVMINEKKISSKHGTELYCEQKVKEAIALNKMIHENN